MHQLADCFVDLSRRQVVRDGGSTDLTEREASLLGVLLERYGSTVTRAELLQDAFGYAPGVRSRAVDHTVARLRKKLELDPGEPRILVSVYGGGYRLEGRPPSTEEGPVAAGELIGRDEDVTRLEGLLVDRRFVTLAGPGGVGKTSLAREVLSRWPASRRGVFVDLQAARTVDEVLAHTHRATTIALSTRGRAASVEQIGAGLASWGDALVVFDNVEQLEREASELLGRWADGAPELTVLVTTRRAPGPRGSALLRLDGLSVDHGIALLASDHGDNEALTALVELLEGNPLALHLARRPVRWFGPRRLVEDGGRALVGLTTQGGPVASLGWSWELLSPGAREALLVLSRLRAPVDLEDVEGLLSLRAETVPEAGGPGVDALVGELADQSLLAPPSTRGAGGLGVPPVLRRAVAALVEEQLPDVDRVVARWLAASVEALRRDRREGEEDGEDARAWLLARLPDLLHHARKPGPVGRRCAEGLARVGFALPWELLVQAVEAHRDDPSAGLLHAMAAAAATRGRDDGWLGELEERVAQSEAGEASGEARVVLGEALAGRDPAQAEDHLRAALEHARSHGLEALEARALDLLALVAGRRGDLHGARDGHLAARAMYGFLGHRRGEARSLGNLAKVLRALGDLDEAEAMGRACLQRLQEVEDRKNEAIATLNLGNVLLTAGRTEDAEVCFRLAVALHREVGNALGLAHVGGSLGAVALLQDRPTEAEVCYREAALHAGRAGDRRLQGWLRGCLGVTALARDRANDAVVHFSVAAEGLAEVASADQLTQAAAQRVLALVLADRADEADAVMLPEGAEDPDTDCLVALAVALRSQTLSDEQLARWQAERPLLRVELGAVARWLRA